MRARLAQAIPTPQVVRAMLGGGDTAGARANLDTARALARPLLAITGDALVSDAIAVIDRAIVENDTARVRALAGAKESHSL
jgi:hypothetical protein